MWLALETVVDDVMATSVEFPGEYSPADTQVLDSFWAFGLYNCRIIDLDYFKLLRLWWFLTTAKDNIIPMAAASSIATG